MFVAIHGNVEGCNIVVRLVTLWFCSLKTKTKKKKKKKKQKNKKKKKKKKKKKPTKTPPPNPTKNKQTTHAKSEPKQCITVNCPNALLTTS
jgi:mannitol-specific phosphotransferase system IIBC component